MTHSLLIRNAKIYDGSGAPPFIGSVTVTGCCFSEVVCGSDCFRESGTRIIDARGLSLAPGFIDAHAHSDLTLLASPEAFSKVSQGITTEINGNCGHSLFPVTPSNYDYVSAECAKYGIPCTWNSFSEYRTALALRKPALRTFFLCGHNTLASAYPGKSAEQAEALSEAIRQGALGLSTGLLYAPGRDEPQANLLTLMHVLRKTDSLYATHLRSEGDRLLEAVEEAILLAQHAAKRLHISHLKTAGQKNWHKLPALFDSIYSAQQNGLTITADRYPYTLSQTSFSVVLPSEYDSMRDCEIQTYLAGHDDVCQSLACNPELDERAESVILSASSKPGYASLLGKTIGESARKMDMTSSALAVQILRDDAACAMAAFPGMSPDNLQRILDLPFVCCGSDENATPSDNSLGRGHPRRFGSLPLFLKQVAKRSSMAEAIRRVTSLPASIFRLPKIGKIAPGFFADFVLFDEDRLDSRADFARPHTPADGIILVALAGKPTFGNGIIVQ